MTRGCVLPGANGDFSKAPESLRMTQKYPHPAKAQNNRWCHKRKRRVLLDMSADGTAQIG
jgi:hypothetical protein